MKILCSIVLITCAHTTHANEYPIPVKKPDHAYTLPKTPIENDQAKLYQKIFTAQAKGDISAADDLIAELSDHRLYGHVLFQRYMHPDYTSTFGELKTWLEHYGDHPQAHRIFALATRKDPIAAINLEKPKNRIHIIRRPEPTMRTALRHKSARKRSNEDITQINRLNRDIRSLLIKGDPATALTILKKAEQKNILDHVEFDSVRANIAASHFYGGDITPAITIAAKASSRSGMRVPKAGWIAGLAAWMQEDYKTSALYFENVGRSNYASSWTKAAGSYWAARAHKYADNRKAHKAWLKRAAKHPRTFYGLIATHALGQDFDFNWDIPPFAEESYNRLATTNAGFRAIALADVGRPGLAEAELIRMNLDDTALQEAVFAFALHAHLPGLAMRLGSHFKTAQDNQYYDAALYPVGPWKLEEKEAIDAALIHAIMRQESRFDPNAQSASGAKGLMQLMPATAKAIAPEKNIDVEDPNVNLALGQKYLSNLLKHDAVQNDLTRLLVAYNAGPGNLQKWSNRFPGIEDSLLFIELIPAAETRAYVERVLANYWIYRLRDNLETPTLDAITAGKPADYKLASAQ